MKRYNIKWIAVAGLAAVLMAGCASTGTSNTTDGVVGGAAAGALVGQLAGGDTRSTLIGAAVGAAAGGAIGYSLDQQANDIARSLGTGVNNDPLAYLDPEQDLIVSNNGRYVKIMFRDRMMFPTNSSRLTRSASYKVGKVGEILRQYPQTIIETAGYTDSRGGFDYNMGLSRERAKSVADRLYASGIQNHSYVTGCSLQNPLVPNTSSQNMALNRRVEVYLYPNSDVRTDVCR
ncbi:MAG TPA: OmpA family protein [Epsilonproteobacteria bacterium]|nr:OmpA family protein [Campylobacterota bacterium]HHH37299.1 OmpA family protein [Campylobacterota bacterium]